MKRLTVAAAALAAGMLTIVAQSQAESDRNIFHKPVAKVAAADRKAEKPAAKDIADKDAKRIASLAKTKSLMANKAEANAKARANAKENAEELGIDVQKTASKDTATQKRVASLVKTKSLMANKAEANAKARANAKENAEEPGIDVQKTASKDAATPKRVASLVKTKTAKTSNAKAGKVAIDFEKTASITRVRPDLKAIARKSVQGLESGAAGESVSSAAGYTTLVSRYATAYGVPVSLAHAVISIESNYRPNTRGSAGEIGLMQIKPATARMMGYSGSASGLFNPETNIKFGMKYLGMAHQLSGGTTCGTILRYNAGHAARRMNPVSAAYCSKVKHRLGAA